jgi:Uma2 family endonuclease
MAVGEITTKRWTTGEYHRLGELGLLDDGRSELIEGEIYMMSPQGGKHAQVVSLLLRVLQTAFGSGCHVRVQAPLHLSETSEPEPDLAVIQGDPLDYPEHPTNALLVAEVSDTTIRFDRETKELLYARASIPEYWLVNLKFNEVEVRRQPSSTGYLDFQMLQIGDSIAPVTLPNVQIAVSSFLP